MFEFHKKKCQMLKIESARSFFHDFQRAQNLLSKTLTSFLFQIFHNGLLDNLKDISKQGLRAETILFVLLMCVGIQFETKGIACIKDPRSGFLAFSTKTCPNYCEGGQRPASNLRIQ